MSMSIAEQHAQRCVHYQRDPSKMFGKGKDACAAGVVYDELARVEELGRAGCMLRLPCIKRHHEESARGDQPLCECALLKWPTKEECEQEQRELEEYIDRLMLANPIIREIKDRHEGTDWAGNRQCPVCQGVLSMTHAAVNGHVHGVCATEGCLSWME